MLVEEYKLLVIRRGGSGIMYSMVIIGNSTVLTLGSCRESRSYMFSLQKRNGIMGWDGGVSECCGSNHFATW